ncbi:hypothetical protein ACI3KS_08415 [Microbacterium sp. ZW T5_45]|uniref:hypothetical protein n=1 Tax=Microbacterium sp. ZW T5_45 TaxID=3378080 RepID=UPI003851C538
MSTPHGPSFDARPLTDPVDPKAVTAFAAGLRSRRTVSRSSQVFSVIGLVVLVALLLMAFGVMLTPWVSRNAARAESLLTPIVVGAVILAAAVGVVGVVRWRAARIRRWRLGRFAEVNGFQYTERMHLPNLPGMIFDIGTSREATDIIAGSRPRHVEFGNYEYTVKRGKSSTTYRWGYVAVKLSAPLPHIVLDAKGNNGFGSNLPVSFRGVQRLSLEGDFNEYFELYCPRGYERDALYLFTPDVMARFIDNSAELDVEIVDGWMFLYTRRRVSTLDPATWAWLFGVVGALNAKADQWARWRDDRLLLERERNEDSTTRVERSSAYAPVDDVLITPPPGVAREGRRLRRRPRWIGLVAGVIAVLIFGWMRMAGIR